MTERREDYQDNGRLARIEEKIDKIAETIHGNGNEGLKTMVFRHDETLNSMRANDRAWVGYKVALGLALFSSLISVAIAVFR